MSTIESTNGLGTKTVYGPRTSDEVSLGKGIVNGVTKEVRLVVKSESATVADFDGQLDDFDDVILPAGALPRRIVVRVKEAYVLGGTTPVISVGTEGTESTNGGDLAEASAEAAGTYEITSFNGTWAAALAADTVLGVNLGGTTPTITAAGISEFVVEYDLVQGG